MDAYASSLPSKNHFELTVACPAGPQNYNNMDIRAMDKYLDCKPHFFILFFSFRQDFTTVLTGGLVRLLSRAVE